VSTHENKHNNINKTGYTEMNNKTNKVVFYLLAACCLAALQNFINSNINTDPKFIVSYASKQISHIMNLTDAWIVQETCTEL
jgi:hypothetical protein